MHKFFYLCLLGCPFALIQVNGQSLFSHVPSGNNHVGIRSFVFERSLPDGKIRELNTWIFYPSRKVDREKRKSYVSDDRLLNAMKQEKYLDIDDGILNSWATLKTNSVEDALPVDKKFPIVFILHGRGSSKINYTLVAEEICSHGYVVAIADHPGSGLTILKDGTKVTLNDPADLTTEVQQMSGDVCFLIRELPKNKFISELMDISNIGIIGHSLGSMALFNTALNNCGFKAAINFDGYPFGEAMSKGINIPHLTLWGEVPTWLGVSSDTLNARRYKTWQDFIQLSNKELLVVKEKGMYHTDFNDLIFFRTDIQKSRYLNAIDPYRGHAITLAVTVAYLNYRLKKGSKDDVLKKIKKHA